MRRCFALTSRAAFIGLALCAFLPRAALAQSDLDRAYRIIAAKTFVDLTTVSARRRRSGLASVRRE